MAAPLIAVGHGSRDPRSAATVHALLDVVRAREPGLDVRAAFLDLSAPRLPDVLAAVHADGHAEAVVVPLLLGRAYHARVDIPGAVTRAGRRFPRLAVRTADVLGPDARLEAVALRRLSAAGADPADTGLGVVLAGAGSSHAPANAAVARVAGGWNWPATAAFAAAADPDVPTAIARLRAAGARRIAVGSWFLAPGLLPDRVKRLALAAEPDALVAEPLGADADVAEVVLARYAEAQFGTVRRAS
jgi:sirohydrochlorin ferrochelatase